MGLQSAGFWGEWLRGCRLPPEMEQGQGLVTPRSCCGCSGWSREVDSCLRFFKDQQKTWGDFRSPGSEFAIFCEQMVGPHGTRRILELAVIGEDRGK